MNINMDNVNYYIARARFGNILKYFLIAATSSDDALITIKESYFTDGIDLFLSMDDIFYIIDFVETSEHSLFRYEMLEGTSELACDIRGVSINEFKKEEIENSDKIFFLTKQDILDLCSSSLHNFSNLDPIFITSKNVGKVQ